jgi:uncharacterized protein YjiS (DUF1127 family)
MSTVYPLPTRVVVRAGAEIGGWRQLLQRLRRAGSAAIRTWQANRRMRAAYVALARLDAATMRDLGIHYSEIGSYVAESHGLAQVTRWRVAPRNHEIIDTARARFSTLDHVR